MADSVAELHSYAASRSTTHHANHMRPMDLRGSQLWNR
ncbi:uncharacterized protein DMAD_05857 [Drosophila madeirensis]|uniref:Uncharacterized protein n=1 Tax=Drosophila madeirensis TaxID=30013 RepID=A0AAU9FNE3_DROMD